jgi:HD superfamily phosphodiesterase
MILDLATAIRPVASAIGSTGRTRASLIPRPPKPSSTTAVSSELRSCLIQHSFEIEKIESVVEATDTHADLLTVSELDSPGFNPRFVIEFGAAGLDLAQITEAYKVVLRQHHLLRTIFVQHRTTL